MPRDKEKRKLKQTIPDDDDDSSVDSKGNLRNLIDYDYEDEEEEKPRRPRKAALLAKRRVRRMLDVPSESSRSSKEDEKKRKIAKKKNKKDDKPRLEVVEDEASTDEEVLELKLEEIQAKLKAKAKAKAKPKHKKKKVVESSEEETPEETEEDEEDDEEEDEDEDDEDEEDDDEEEDSEEEEDEEYNGKRGKRSGTLDIVISDLFGEGSGRDPNKPQKYNMKKEPASVKRFVELVQKESEDEDNIDTDITYFKSLPALKQAELLRVLEIKNSPLDVQVPLKFKILEKVTGKPDLSRIAMAKYNALCNIEPSSTEYYKVSHWINGFTGMPLSQYRDIPVKMEDGPEKCGEFMGKVHKCMDAAIYGHDEAKLQIMQFVSSWIANPQSHGNVLSIHGPPGIGKTSLIKDGVAKALDRPFHFITLGGATDASFLDGHSYTYEGSTWGKIVDVLIQSKCMNPVIYFDELDKVSETPKGDEIMNILIHLTDQSQNDRFQDKYFTGIDLDLSRCLFIFSHNNNEKVNPILRDRMYNIAVSGFNMKQKLHIAENYLLVQALKEAGLHEKVSISNDILQHIIENYTGGEQGVRELKRCIQTIISKLNLLRFYNNPKQVPFAIEGFQLPFTLKKSHAELFLKKKEEENQSYRALYT